MQPIYNVGIIGTGFIGTGILLALETQSDLQVTKVLTRRNLSDCHGFPRKDLLTDSVADLIDHCDLVVECSGDAIYATEVLDQVLEAHLPVVTMDSELHVTTGSYLAKKGKITEAEGDQPGCLAALRENAVQMGFKPLVYGNIKGFLNLMPTLEDMQYWSHKQGISLDQVASFTDGTKVQIEQAFVANGLGAALYQPGLLGTVAEDIRSGGVILADAAKRLGQPISDYILSPKSPAGVFLVAEHEESQNAYLRYLKMGEGPYYTLVQNFHLCHLEVAKTIRRIVNGGDILLNNTTNPKAGVVAVAKRSLAPGDAIKRGIGSFDVRGIAITLADHWNQVPIGLLSDAVITKPIEPGQILSFDDVDLQDTLALRAWFAIRESCRGKAVEKQTALVAG
ncbi:NAD(P)-dependent oxidoreductase [Myxacorys almedinensis]|uniref:NAD(P)-dependent oxidoreductase n=1 Tax=Myxacorys almedinensis A TaxID=2690445 RepID=A0A8J8CPK1_9CYAN|nr:NAD(P)-dependent oxidoreductase [Myxacorys almedinensis]NDJ19592.1 NAD(P)-dependent oxidoreductase [Myxacorys almedinensis A]